MDKPDDYKVDYDMRKLEAVMRYFSEGFKPKRGRNIIDVEWWVDTSKGEVIFRIFSGPKEAPSQGREKGE